MIMSDLRIDHQLSAREKLGAVKVLVVDEDEDILDLMKVVLDPLSFILATADSVQNSVELVKTFQPDVIVVDLLVKTGCLDILQHIRRLSKVPVLVLSAVNNPVTVAQALNNGADDYLTKPMKSSVLIANLNKLARRGRAEREAHQGNGSYRL
jgi:DNA-binding response OmpR family regulator